MAEKDGPAHKRDAGIRLTRQGSAASRICAKVIHFAMAVVSPTRALAACRKSKCNAEGTTKVIVTSNHRYLAISVATVAIVAMAMFLAGHELKDGPATLPLPIRILWGWFLWSRATEVLVAFYTDAFDKLSPTEPNSTLTPSQRVRLALNSYGELVLNFALGYALLPVSGWHAGPQPTNIADLLFYSASTITTSGGGGFIPDDLALKFLTIYEIACGLILLVVCFAIYAGRALGPSERSP